MNNLIDFFEKLKFEKVCSDLEFSTANEKITISKHLDGYLFYFSRFTELSKTNLCQEIVFITEDTAHLKLSFDNVLADYLDLKENKQKIEFLQQSEKSDYPKEFVADFKNLLLEYNSFYHIYVSLAVENCFPEKEDNNIKKVKL